MTDTTPPIAVKKTLAKASFGVVYMDVCQHLTPPLAGYLNMFLPILGVDLSFEIIVACQAVIGGVIAYPEHFVQGVTNGILFVKGAFKQWRDAAR